MTRPDTAAQAYDWANTPRMGWYHSGTGSIELALTLDDARSASHSGPCDADIAELQRVPYIAEQLAKISDETARDVATESGRNDYEHAANDDREGNIAFILWMACCDITENEVQS